MDPRRLRQWQQVNEVDYVQKLSDVERQWLDNFNCEHFKQRPRQDALDHFPIELTADIEAPEACLYQAPQNYGGVTLLDLKMYLRINKEGVSERQLSRESKTPRSTLKYRMRLVRKLLVDVRWSNLLGNLDGEEINAEI